MLSESVEFAETQILNFRRYPLPLNYSFCISMFLVLKKSSSRAVSQPSFSYDGTSGNTFNWTIKLQNFASDYILWNCRLVSISFQKKSFSIFRWVLLRLLSFCNIYYIEAVQTKKVIFFVWI